MLDDALVEVAVRKAVKRKGQQARCFEPSLEFAQSAFLPQAPGRRGAQPQPDPEGRVRTDDLLDGQSVLLKIRAGLIEIRARMHVRAIAQLIGHGVGKSGKRPIMKRRKHFPRAAGSKTVRKGHA